MKKIPGAFEKDLAITNELLVDVDFDYLPEERMTRDSPGCPAEIEIENVWWSEGKEELSEEEFNKYEEKIKEALVERRLDYL